MDVRRVVTGQTQDGRSYVASDETVRPITVGMMPGAEFHRIWGADEVPTVPTEGEQPAAGGWFPPAKGFRFGFATLPPAGDGEADGGEDLDMDAAAAEAEDKLPGLLGVFEPDEPGMHTTESIDFLYVVSGNVTLELGDGSKTDLRPGDTVVQNGTRHRWINSGSEPVVLCLALVGAETAS
jgi:mannose-6-phosphate isomerase-like protein (cupin superfamily)